MRKWLGWVGAILGSSAGWWAGARLGLMPAVIGSAVGTGAGLYLGWWIAERLMD
jgi:phage tail tape-measure protein